MKTATDKTRVLFISIAPPSNDCGIRVLMHRHLVQRSPFELHVASNAVFPADRVVHTSLELPYPLWRLKKTRFGPRLKRWFNDYENFVWPLWVPQELEKAVESFRPDVILTQAETCLSHLAAKTARKYRLPLASWFMDWFPIMEGHYGHKWARSLLSRRYRWLYQQSDVAFCISDGMKEVLGQHPNSHVIYPMVGQHHIPEKVFPPKSGKFRLVYVGSVQNFYGRMLCSLLERLEPLPDMELIIVGPNADWPAETLQRAKAKGVYLGFKPPEEAAAVLAGADALLVVMSFEQEFRLFMETSFTTKFVDYTAFNKPILLWGPEYCAPARLVRRAGGACWVGEFDADRVVAAAREIATDPQLRQSLSDQARQLNSGLFNPERLQEILVREMEAVAGKPQRVQPPASLQPSLGDAV